VHKAILYERAGAKITWKGPDGYIFFLIIARITLKHPQQFVMYPKMAGPEPNQETVHVDIKTEDMTFIV